MSAVCKKMTAICICLVLSVAYLVCSLLWMPQISVVPTARGTLTERNVTSDPETGDPVFTNVIYELGKDITAVRVTELSNLGAITKINYVPNEFITPGRLSENIQIVDLTENFEFAEKGTLILVILNLDPYAEDFYEQIDALEPYRVGENINFTLSLPQVFSASNIYQKSKLIASHGAIENYDYIEFSTSYTKKTETFSAGTGNTTFELPFYTRRETLDDVMRNAQVITIHYQSDGTSLAGFKGFPLIGGDGAVNSVRQHSSNLLIMCAILSVIVMSVLIVLSILKRTRDFIFAVILVFGFAVSMMAHFISYQGTTIPLLWAAISLSATFFVLGGALLSMKGNINKKFKYAFSAFALLGAFAAFIRPFTPYAVSDVLKTVCMVLEGICVLGLIAFIMIAALNKTQDSEILRFICAVLVVIIVTALPILEKRIYSAYSHPLFWLAALTVGVTFGSVFKIFIETEKANAYLTENLNLEVKRQLKDIRAVVQERDELLRFVSHDMKKPLMSSLPLIDTSIEREQDAELVKALRIIQRNMNRVISNLSEVADYSRYNYIAESSQVVNLKAVCASLYEFHLPDCNANGIILKNLVGKNYKVFAKPHGLENAVSNIILNAIEHANCETITLSAKVNRNKVVLCIADDGKGIDSGLDVFGAYVSENKVNTEGLGLYICKSIVESMNGELGYSSENGGTTFYITLLQA